MKFENVSIIGLGYIGLPTAGIVASKKIRVYGLDINEDAVSTINKGNIHIKEPKLASLIKKVVNNGYLSSYR